MSYNIATNKKSQAYSLTGVYGPHGNASAETQHQYQTLTYLLHTSKAFIHHVWSLQPWLSLFDFRRMYYVWCAIWIVGFCIKNASSIKFAWQQASSPELRYKPKLYQVNIFPLKEIYSKFLAGIHQDHFLLAQLQYLQANATYDLQTNVWSRWSVGI